MNLVEWATVIGGGAAAIAVVFALWQVWLSITNERRRVQPIVIAHEADGPKTRQPSAPGWRVLAYITNDGQGAAYNVRFGIELADARWAYKMADEAPDKGNRQTVIVPGSRVPDCDAYEIRINTIAIWSAAHPKVPGKIDERRVYWCRYENAIGQTWETLNPGDRTAGLIIRRVRWVRWREWREARERERVMRRGEEVADRLSNEMAAAKEQHEQASAASSGSPPT